MLDIWSTCFVFASVPLQSNEDQHPRGDLPVVVRCNFQAEIFFWASYLRDYHVTAVFVFVCTRLLSQTLEVMNYCKPIQQRAQ